MTTNTVVAASAACGWESFAAPLIAWVGEIPKEVWAAILGAVIAAAISGLTTWRANANARRMLTIQLDALAKDAERTRKMELRRDVLLPAVRAASSAPANIGRLLNTKADLSKVEEELVATAEALAGIHVIGSADTVQATVEYSTFIRSLHLDVVLERSQAVVQQAVCDAHQLSVQRELAKGEALTEMMKEENLQASNPARFARLRQQWQIHERLLAKFIEDRDQANARLSVLLVHGLETFRDNSERLQELQVNAVLAFREELGLPIDEQAYRDTAQKAAAKSDEALSRAINFLNGAAARQ